MSAVSTDDPDGGTSLSGRSTELQLEPPPTAGRGWHRLVEWSGTSPPVAALLLAGIVLGPHGIALLSAGTLALLAPAVPVGIGALGVLLGLSVAPGNADGRRVALPASVSVLVTLAIVGGGLMLAARAEYATLAPAVLVLVTGAAVCAATAPVLPAGHPLEPRSREVRTAELGVLLSILAGSGVLAWLQSGTRVPAGLSIAAAAGLIVALALAVWLLLTVASNETEERVLTVSALLLVGGVSDALATPALLGGVAAGCVWRYAGGPPVTSLNRDVLFVQHPLIVGLLLLAGAAADLSRASWVFAALYVALRVVGRLAGAIAARRVGGVSTPDDLGRHLLSPGIYGVALAVDAAAVIGPDASLLLGTVVLGTVGAELVASLLPARGAAA